MINRSNQSYRKFNDAIVCTIFFKFSIRLNFKSKVLLSLFEII